MSDPVRRFSDVEEDVAQLRRDLENLRAAALSRIQKKAADPHDHPEYVFTDGSRPFTGPVQVPGGTFPNPAIQFGGTVAGFRHEPVSDRLQFRAVAGDVLFLGTSSRQVQAASDGSAGAPAYTFANRTDMGMWQAGPGSLYLRAAGTAQIEIDGRNPPNYVKFQQSAVDMFRFALENGQFLGVDGSAAAPTYSFMDSTAMGMYRASSWLAFATAGVQRFYLGDGFINPAADLATRLGDSAHRWTDVWTDFVIVGDGSAAFPRYTFQNDRDTGFFHPGGGGRIAVAAEGGFHFQFRGDSNFFSTGDVAYDGTHSLGWSSRRWKEVWAVDGTVNTSDPAAKRDKRPVDPAAALGRVREVGRRAAIHFRWADGTRTHEGFDATVVADVHGEESAAYIDPAVDADRWEADGPPERRTIAVPDEETGELVERPESDEEYQARVDEWQTEVDEMRAAPKGLRYHEMIPDLYAAVAGLADRIEQLERRPA